MNRLINIKDGELYNPNTEDLIALRLKSKKLCQQYNNIDVSDFAERTKLLNELFYKIGNNITIEYNFYCDYGKNISVGDNFYANHNLVILDCAEVVFGDNIFIGPNCGFYCAYHPLNTRTRNKRYEYAASIKVGNDVWFGGNVVVLPGVTIGDNVVIGAGSVVTKDIPSNSVAYGNPCKVRKKL